MVSIVQLVSSMIREVCCVLEKDMERHEKLCSGLEFVMKEMEIVTPLLKGKGRRGAVPEIRFRQLQDLVYDVEDFVEGLWKPGQYGKVLVAIGMDPRAKQIIRVEYFKETLSSLKQQWDLQISESNQDEDDTDSDIVPAPPGDADQEELEGTYGPICKILELLSPSPFERLQLRVVSIVGCRGVGKTALARAVYVICSASQEFDCVAWVPASGCNTREALSDKILRSVREDLASRAAEAEGDYSAMTLQEILSNKRCLVFVDDVRDAQVWKHTVDARPLNGSKSIIIVTTSVRSVATARSSGSYVYNMQCLCPADSKRLFWRNVYGYQREPPFSMESESENIFRKCGGLPLALTSAARHLSMEGNNVNSDHCKDLGEKFGSYYLYKNEVTVFKGMRRALMQCYDNLPDYDHRVFLLYLSLFPRGHQIKSKSIVRRLKAEGLVVNEDSYKCFDKLIDHCIVEPVQISNNSVVVKGYQIHDVVLEYIIQKSLHRNLFTLIQGLEPLPIGSNSVRRLSIQSSTKQRFAELEDRSAALRSLTMFKSEPFDLQRFKLLRLLDLEGCTGLDKRFLDGLSELLLLRYLSLRNTRIDDLPAQMEKLQRLEMLDIRGTKVGKLHFKIIMLPKLAYLFGMFQLSDLSNDEEIKSFRNFLENESVLHTLSGYVTNKRHGPEHVLLHGKNLKKIKVWCNDTPADAEKSFPVADHGSSCSTKKWRFFGKTRERKPRGMKNAEEGTRCDNTDFISLLNKPSRPLESVSIVSSQLCTDFLFPGSPARPCKIGSIKLRGNLDRLPDSHKLSKLCSIKKLQLFSTGLSIEDLSVLQYLRRLDYLKLVEYSHKFCDGICIVEKNGFESLRSLYIEAVSVPSMQFKEGAMECLTSLHLLCPDISPKQPPSETIKGISHLANLSELILHSSMQEDWDTIAYGHPNRPCVKRQPENNTQHIAA